METPKNHTPINHETLEATGWKFRDRTLCNQNSTYTRDGLSIDVVFSTAPSGIDIPGQRMKVTGCLGVQWIGTHNSTLLVPIHPLLTTIASLEHAAGTSGPRRVTQPSIPENEDGIEKHRENTPLPSISDPLPVTRFGTWVDVNERLPPLLEGRSTSTHVLVYSNAGIYMGFVSGAQWCTPSYSPVTHWMELPPTP